MKKISSAHVLLLVITAFQLVVSLGLSLLLAFVPGFYLPMWLQLLLSPLTMVIPFAIYCIWTRSNPLTLIRFKKVKPLSIVLAVLVMVFAYPVIILLNLLSMLFVDNAMANVLPSVVEMGIIPALLLMAVIPAVMEETIFRGCLYNAYSRVRPLAGVFLSALLFGLMHMNFNQMPYAFFLGVIMALMLEATDSIVIPMIMHFSLNGFTTVLSFLTMGASQGMAAASSGSTSLTDAISQAYKEVMAQGGTVPVHEQRPGRRSGCRYGTYHAGRCYRYFSCCCPGCLDRCPGAYLCRFCHQRAQPKGNTAGPSPGRRLC